MKGTPVYPEVDDLINLIESTEPLTAADVRRITATAVDESLADAILGVTGLSVLTSMIGIATGAGLAEIGIALGIVSVGSVISADVVDRFTRVRFALRGDRRSAAEAVAKLSKITEANPQVGEMVRILRDYREKGNHSRDEQLEVERVFRKEYQVLRDRRRGEIEEASKAALSDFFGTVESMGIKSQTPALSAHGVQDRIKTKGTTRRGGGFLPVGSSTGRVKQSWF